MNKPRICAAITEINAETILALESGVDFWEVRMDLIGKNWPEVSALLKKPWIACNRSPLEGGKAEVDENTRLKELLHGLESGAAIIDIELSTRKLAETVIEIKKKAQCQISYHNLKETPATKELARIVEIQLQSGADICKVVTQANSVEDNLKILRLVKQFEGIKIVAFTMGVEGRLSRVLSCLSGAYYTFASVESGKESAPGQINIMELRDLYRLIGV
jgi:3-dehydroquinate dehydratase type I